MDTAKDLSAFTYLPLNESEIRLLQLDISIDTTAELIRCEVRTFPRNESPPFTALSYTWGSGVTNEYIILNKSRFAITSNLNLFLKQAVLHAQDDRYDRLGPFDAKLDKEQGKCGWDGKWLWIDSVCINQRDDLEKSHQVQRMRQLYETANAIVVWLGPSEKNTELGFRELARRWPCKPGALNIDREALGRASSYLYRQAVAEGLNSILTRAYWQRAWIVQEATAPRPNRQTVVWCGRYFIDFVTLIADALQWSSEYASLIDTDTFDPEIFRLLRHIRTSRSLSAVGLASPLNLYAVLAFAQFMEAKDPRDKIFALLPLVQDSTELETFRPDYHVSAESLFIQVAKNAIERDKSLDILAFCGGSRTLELPSWVPDWTSTDIPKAFMRQNIRKHFPSWPLTLHRYHWGNYDPLYKACGSSTVFKGSVDKDTGLLHAKGFKFDIISSILSLSEAKATGRSYVGGWSRQEALARTLCTDARARTMNPGSMGPLAGSRRGVSFKIFEKKFGLVHLDFVNETQRYVGLNRQLLHSKKGYIGLGPCQTQVGDAICILSGGQFPLILRQESQVWEVVGEVYLHGVMDGEAVEQAMRQAGTKVNEDIMKDTFVIK